MSKKPLKILTPVGNVPAPDINLREKLRQVPKDANLSKYFDQVTLWERVAVRKFREQEKTGKSGKLTIRI